MRKLVCVALVSLVIAVSGARAQDRTPQAPSQQPQATPEQLQQAIQSLYGQLLAEQEKTAALATSAAQKTQQIAQLQEQVKAFPTACKAEVAKANPKSDVDDKLVVTVKK